MNDGDGLSCVVAVRSGAPLLFTGGDVGRTDLATHPASRPQRRSDGAPQAGWSLSASGKPLA